MATRKPESEPAEQPDHWSQQVTETSDAMDLKPDVFTLHDPKAIARSLKASAEHSDRRKADPYRSSMSMLTFYINRAGHNLEAAQHERLETAKDELRKLFDKPPAATKTPGGAAKKPAAKKATTKKATTKKATTKKATAKKATAQKATAQKATARTATAKTATARSATAKPAAVKKPPAKRVAR